MNLSELYQDLHAHPELSFAETRTAGIVASRLEELGVEVTTGVGRTGVVGVLRNGEGPIVGLRADMDALPVEEKTGLPYASTVRAIDAEGVEVPVMHACGHDVHVTCLLGAFEELAGSRDTWSGTVVGYFQPSEENGAGAAAMVADGVADRFPRPSVLLGQHVAPLPAGMVSLHAGPAMAGADSVTVTLYGAGGHGSRPEATVDPVVAAASVVMRLQTVVAREVAAADRVVVTVGAVQAGTKHNIIPDTAVLKLSVRTAEPRVRERVLVAIERIIRAEAVAAGMTREPSIEYVETLPVLVNDPDTTEATRAALAAMLGESAVIDFGAVTGSEDVGRLADGLGAPCCYWLLGGGDPELVLPALASGDIDAIPSNHSPLFAPVIEPTLSTGVRALVSAARHWLGA
ncbi:MAG TPA: amidohydrolase [Nocardioides sp.]|nr:amidohydrolase [Nocardioides sp.]